MKLDGGIPFDMAQAAEAAKRLEAAGYTGAWGAETTNDPFLPLALAAEHTERIELGTSIAVAFARNPMTLANIGYDLQKFSGGRFFLGLGSQIKPHITKRFSMPWSHPAARMREMVLAIHAIWDCWQGEAKLDFRGDFYSHTLMTPFFNPGPNPHGKPRIFLAAVGEMMMEVTGEVADGWISHAFTTPAYMHDVAVPAMARGAAKAGRSIDEIEVSIPAFIVTGTDEDEMHKAAASTRQQIAFYGSTPAYKNVLAHHGWEDAHPELNRLSKEGKWVEMGEVIDDTMLDEFAIVAEPDRVAGELTARFGDVVDRVSFYAPFQSDPAAWAPVIESILAA